MGFHFRIQFIFYSALALTALFAQGAYAQDSSTGKTVTLPPIDVSSSRLGEGIVGASTTVITSGDIQRAPESTLQDLLAREAGIQTTSLYGGVNGTGTVVGVVIKALAPGDSMLSIVQVNAKNSAQQAIQLITTEGTVHVHQ